MNVHAKPPLDPAKFRDPRITARGEARAHVALGRLSTLWFATGTLCNLACTGCYIESSPKNDRLAYLTRAEAKKFLDEIAADARPVQEIGFTGGEPFMNPEIISLLDDSLSTGCRVIVLTNAMRPMQRHAKALRDLNARFPGQLAVRVSLDGATQNRHESERGPGSWAPALAGIIWLAQNGFDLRLATRLMWGDSEAETRAAFAALFLAHGLKLDAQNPEQLVCFPEMDAAADVPEITEACWEILGKTPESVMCASSRMVVKRKGAAAPAVVACTLLPYEPAFELGATLAEAAGTVALNHPHCAKFCVLGGAACSRG